MDKKRSVLNISISIISRILLLIAALLVRRLLIQCHIVETCLIWGMTELVVRKRHGEIVNRREEIDQGNEKRNQPKHQGYDDAQDRKRSCKWPVTCSQILRKD